MNALREMRENELRRQEQLKIRLRGLKKRRSRVLGRASVLDYSESYWGDLANRKDAVNHATITSALQKENINRARWDTKTLDRTKRFVMIALNPITAQKNEPACMGYTHERQRSNSHPNSSHKGMSSLFHSIDQCLDLPATVPFGLTACARELLLRIDNEADTRLIGVVYREE